MTALWFVTGGARSGKSTFAQLQAEALGPQVAFIATMEGRDEETRARIERHRRERRPEWITIEAPLDIATALRGVEPRATVIVDCLSLWVANLFGAAMPEPPAEDVDQLERAASLADEMRDSLGDWIDIASRRSGTTIVVSNEVGSGVVPAFPLGRHYRDVLGLANQLVSSRASRAWLLIAGRPLELPPARD